MASSGVAGLAADLIRFDTTNRGGGDGLERPAAEYVAARLAEAGLEPALCTSIRSPASARRMPSAMWLRQELPVQRIRTVGLFAGMGFVPGSRLSPGSRGRRTRLGRLPQREQASKSKDARDVRR